MALSRVFSSKTWGAIPQLNRLGYLKAMYLRGNRFSGEIPPDFFSKMKSLKKVWLSNNKFTGGIPPSLAELPRLSELHLEKNQFSGSIPPIDQPTLMSFNVSNDKLEGEIPPNLAIFNYSSFDGIDHLCGDKSGRGCEKYSADIIRITNRCWQQHSRCKFRCRIDQREWELPKRWDQAVKGLIMERGGVGELVIVNTEKGAFGLPDLMKASAEVLGNGGMGSSYV
ncbi:hypothetical protein OIU77_023496 [Salix suchowensis]|uniref:Uncharacterized protein n=1 Tax=Salix suchowensis TaxID=1278906 RepID=A0ABQ9C447_9ROSI|nr:hypothetical protein OIU77_023496 [Salix suchowensis]